MEKMKRNRYFYLLSIFFLISLLGIFECTPEFINKKEQIKGLSIYANLIIENKGVDSLIYNTQDRIKIYNIISFFKNPPKPFYKCGYTGTVVLKLDKMDSVEIRLNNSPECSHYVYTLNENSYSKKLDLKGCEFFDSLFNVKIKDKKLLF